MTGLLHKLFLVRPCVLGLLLHLVMEQWTLIFEKTWKFMDFYGIIVSMMKAWASFMSFFLYAFGLWVLFDVSSNTHDPHSLLILGVHV